MAKTKLVSNYLIEGDVHFTTRKLLGTHDMFTIKMFAITPDEAQHFISLSLPNLQKLQNSLTEILDAQKP